MRDWCRFGLAGLSLTVWTAGCQANPAASPTTTAALAAYASPSPSPSETPWKAEITAPTETGPSPTPFVHVVKAGDTLLAIALKYGVELDQLLAANPQIDPHFLTVGQALNIPGPNGEAVQSLLPTSTPWPLSILDGRCFPTPTNVMVCLATLAAPPDRSIEAMAVQFSLVGPDGQVIHSQTAYPPLNLLPAGGSMPFVAEFDVPPSEAAGLQTVLRSAVPVENPADRYLTAQVEPASIEYAPDRRMAHVSGTMHVTTEGSDGGAWRQSLLVLAYDVQGTIIGFAKLQFDGQFTQANDQTFSLDVFSLGPPIDSIDFMAEARRIVQGTQTPSP